MKRINPAVFLTILLTAAFLQAEEGMWMPQQIPQLAPRLRTMGFKGDPKAFADLTGQPMGAIVSLGGCTASFVSPDGLIVTNHHCVAGGLQYNSTPQRDLLKDGFLAKTPAEELSNGPNARVFVTTSVVEITDKITGNMEANIPDLERYNQIERRKKEYVADCEKTGQRCTVASFLEDLNILRWFSWRSRMCAWSMLAPRGSGYLAARPTTGVGLGTLATGAFCALMLERMASLPHIPKTMSLSIRLIG